MKHIGISKDPLDPLACIKFISHDESGGHSIFIGKVRSATSNKKVIRLEFEAYEAMAISELELIVEQAIDKWPIKKIWVEHRIGVLSIGESAVIIGVSCPHRDGSFEACRYVIDELKKTVPIWKKEIFDDGEIWVAAHP